jgi:hypothetical protein
MSFASKWFVLLLSIVAALGADKEKPFQAGPVDSYPCRQTIEKVTIAADPFDKEEKTRQAFGKLNPNRYGILPVLVAVRNDGAAALSLDAMRVEYLTESGDRIEATPARDVPRTTGPKKPEVYRGPLPLPRTSRVKSPLSVWEIEGRAFSAKMLPPGQSASGFFYFQAPYRSSSVLYITGIREAASRRELFYFEIPLDK